MRKLVLGAILIGVAGCGSNQNAQQCFLAETAICGTQFDPIQNRPGFGQCLSQGATACGIVPTASPSPTAAK